MDMDRVGYPIITIFLKKVDIQGSFGDSLDVKWPHFGGVTSILLADENSSRGEPSVVGHNKVTISVRGPRSVPPYPNMTPQVFGQRLKDRFNRT